MKVLDYGAERKWQGLSALSVPLLPKPLPPKAAEAIAGVMAQTLLLAKQGETFLLSHMPVWVRPVAVGLSLASELDNAA